MPKEDIFDYCHICLHHDKMTFEHVPPQSAFNKVPIILSDMKKNMYQPPGTSLKGRVQQKGAGGFTLCERCNNKTGEWYGSHFVQLCKEGKEFIDSISESPSLFYLYEIYPLSIIKQIICMFLATNPLSFSILNPELAKFVLCPEKKYLNPKYRLFLYFQRSNIIRHGQLWGKGSKIPNSPEELREIVLRKAQNLYEQKEVYSEITYPPFGYLFTIGEVQIDSQLFEITHFSKYGYKERRSIPMQLKLLPVSTGFPCDYRSEDIVSKAFKNGMKYIDQNKEQFEKIKETQSNSDFFIPICEIKDSKKK